MELALYEYAIIIIIIYIAVKPYNDLMGVHI